MKNLDLKLIEEDCYVIPEFEKEMIKHDIFFEYNDEETVIIYLNPFITDILNSKELENMVKYIKFTYKIKEYIESLGWEFETDDGDRGFDPCLYLMVGNENINIIK